MIGPSESKVNCVASAVITRFGPVPPMLNVDVEPASFFGFNHMETVNFDAGTPSRVIEVEPSSIKALPFAPQTE